MSWKRWCNIGAVKVIAHCIIVGQALEIRRVAVLHIVKAQRGGTFAGGGGVGRIFGAEVGGLRLPRRRLPARTPRPARAQPPPPRLLRRRRAGLPHRSPGRAAFDVAHHRNHHGDVGRLVDRPPQGRPDWDGNHPDPGTSSAPWKIYNIGNSHPEELTHVVSLLEKGLGMTATKEMLPMQPGDVEATYADVKDLENDVGFRPATPINS